MLSQLVATNPRRRLHAPRLPGPACARAGGKKFSTAPRSILHQNPVPVSIVDRHIGMASSLQKLFGIAGRVAVVTGGGRGLGLHIAKTLVENGATVYISSRSAETCKRAAERLSEAGPGVCRALPEDLSSEDGCKRLAAQFLEVESSGKLDILVNNSGVAWGAPFDEFPEKQWDKVMGLNVKTPFLMIRALRPMLERAAAKGSPSRVINIGSITGVYLRRSR
jgi:NAD(P)-dependent dehydrogenase (short-subunit alcohol dehydrogenase family)